MNLTKIVIAGLLIGVNMSSPVLAASGETCLQNNRIWGWQAVDERTLIITDRNYRRFTVRLSGGCVNLDKYAGVALAVRTKTSLGCLTKGDRVIFNAPALGPLNCVVTDVESGVPSTPVPG